MRDAPEAPRSDAPATATALRPAWLWGLFALIALAIPILALLWEHAP